MVRSSILAFITAVLFFISACNRTALDERFHASDLSNWTVIDDPECIEGPSKWQVEQDGWLHQRSNIWGRRGDYLGRWYGTFLVSGDAGWRNYRLSLKAKPEDDDGFGVVFRYKDAEHYYRLFFIEGSMNGGPMARLDKREGADYTEIWARQRGYKKGSEIRIEVDVTGDLIRAKMDDESLFEIRDETYKAGKIGLFCFAQSSQAFDDVRVVSH